MLKTIAFILLFPGLAFAQDYINGQTYRTGPESSTTYLQDSNGGTATIMTYPPGQIMIQTYPGTTTQDLDRAHEETRQAIERLNHD